MKEPPPYFACSIIHSWSWVWDGTLHTEVEAALIKVDCVRQCNLYRTAPLYSFFHSCDMQRSFAVVNANENSAYGIQSLLFLCSQRLQFSSEEAFAAVVFLLFSQSFEMLIWLCNTVPIYVHDGVYRMMFFWTYNICSWTWMKYLTIHQITLPLCLKRHLIGGNQQFSLWNSVSSDILYLYQHRNLTKKTTYIFSRRYALPIIRDPWAPVAFS